MNYWIACEHYSRDHGRNVLMCPYCEQYFLLSNLLTKHVLAQHSKDEIQSKSVSTFYKEINKFMQNSYRKPSKIAAIIFLKWFHPEYFLSSIFSFIWNKQKFIIT